MAPVASSTIAAGLLVMATAASVVQAFDPNLAFNYTVPDTARFLRYVSGQGIPESNENDTNWYTRFETTDRPEEKSLYGGGPTEHHGDSIHPNYLSFSFVGTRAIVNGYGKGFTRGDASATAEGAPQGTLAINYTTNARNVNVSTPSGGVLADTGDLPFGTHNIKLTLPDAKAGVWVTNGLTVQTRMQTTVNNFSAVPVFTEFAAEGENLNARWSFSKRGWTADTPFDSAGNMSTMEPWASYVHATAVGSEGAGASVTIDIPANTSFIVINGTSGPTAGNYFITFDSNGPTLGHSTAVSGSAGALWVAPVMLGSATLDPTAKYNMTISGDKGVGALGLSIHSLTYYGGVSDNFPNLPAEAPTSSGAAPPSSETSIPNAAVAGGSAHRTNTGAIAGGVVGGVLALAIIIGVIIWFMRRRRRQRVNRADPADFVVDETLDSPNPFTVTESRSEKQSYMTGSQSGQSNSGQSHSGLVHGGDNQSHSAGYSSPPSSDGYTSEQLGILAPPPAVGADSRGFNTLLSPLTTASPMKWTMQGSPTSPAGVTPSSPMASTTTPFAALGTDMGRSGRGGASGSNLVRAARTRRPRHQGPRVHQEADGGSLHPDDDDENGEEDDVVLVPPSYDEAWSRSRGGGGGGERSRRDRRDRPRPPQQTNRSSWTNELAMRLKR